LIISLEADITSFNSTIDSVQEKLEINQAHTPRTDKLEKEEAKLKDQLAELTASLKAAKNKLVATKRDKAIALHKIEPGEPVKPGFFFNLTLAEQVPAGNYKHGRIKKEAVKGDPDMITVTGTTLIDDELTDNFGNPLIPGNTYVPVVLSVAITSEENADQYSNSLSKYQVTESFVYGLKKLK